MSFPYQYNDNYSTPNTPASAYPWEVEVATLEQSQHQVALQQQQQQQVQVQESLPIPERIVPSQRPREVGHSHEPVRLHSVEPGRSDSGSQRNRRPHIHVDTSRHPSTSSSSASTSTIGPIRVSPTTQPHHQLAAHPYRRPPSAATMSRRRPADQELQHVRFAGQTSGSSMPAPSSTQSGATSLGSTLMSTSSSATMGLGQRDTGASRGAQTHNRFSIRADMRYDIGSKVLTAMLELPGLKRTEVKIALSTCVYNRVRQVTVSGVSTPTFPSDGWEIRERKFGEFRRVLVVPYDTKVEDVSAEMQDGILVLNIACGPPADSEDRQEITIG